MDVSLKQTARSGPLLCASGDKGRLRILTNKLYADGFKTLGQVEELGRRKIKERYKTTDQNIERLAELLQDYGLDMRS